MEEEATAEDSEVTWRRWRWRWRRRRGTWGWRRGEVMGEAKVEVMEEAMVVVEMEEEAKVVV